MKILSQLYYSFLKKLGICSAEAVESKNAIKYVSQKITTRDTIFFEISHNTNSGPCDIEFSAKRRHSNFLDFPLWYKESASQEKASWHDSSGLPGSSFFQIISYKTLNCFPAILGAMYYLPLWLGPGPLLDYENKKVIFLKQIWPLALKWSKVNILDKKQ